MSYRAFWQRSCRAAAAGAVLKPQGGNCAVLPKIKAASRPACGNVPRWGGWLLYRGKVEIKKYAFAADAQTAQSMV